jgi:hypothetical protein
MFSAVERAYCLLWHSLAGCDGAGADPFGEIKHVDNGVVSAGGKISVILLDNSSGRKQGSNDTNLPRGSSATATQPPT